MVSLVKPYYYHPFTNTKPNGGKPLTKTTFSSSTCSFLNVNKKKFPLLVLKCTQKNNGDNNSNNKKSPIVHFLDSKLKKVTQDPVKYMEILFKMVIVVLPANIKCLITFFYYLAKFWYITSIKEVDDEGNPLLHGFMVPLLPQGQGLQLPQGQGSQLPQGHPPSTQASTSSTCFYFDVPASGTKGRYKISVEEVDQIVITTT